MHLTIIGVSLRKTRKLLSLWFLLHTTVKEKHIGRSRNEFPDSIHTVCVSTGLLHVLCRVGKFVQNQLGVSFFLLLPCWILVIRVTLYTHTTTICVQQVFYINRWHTVKFSPTEFDNIFQFEK